MIASYIDRMAPDRLTGWVVDTDESQKAVDLRIVVDGAVLVEGPAGNARQDLVGKYGSADHGFDFRFDPPLSARRKHYVSIQIAGTGRIVQEFTMPGASGGPAAGALAPLLLTSTGRSGTTVLMRTLAEDPAIVVAGEYPAEFKLLTYYAHALRVLGAPGTTEAAIEPDKMHEYPFRIGPNPFFDHAYMGRLGDDRAFLDILGRRASGHIARAFGAIMQDFYAEIGRRNGKPTPLYFIEKCDVLSETRERVCGQFDGVKEIVLVRDLRDVYCSSRAFWSVGEEFIRNLTQAAKLFLRIKRTHRPEETLIVRYEDFIADRSEILKDVAAFLGLGRLLSAGQDDHRDMFLEHSTSSEPSASIERWRRELSPDQRNQLQSAIGDFLSAFDYPLQ